MRKESESEHLHVTDAARLTATSQQRRITAVEMGFKLVFLQKPENPKVQILGVLVFKKKTLKIQIFRHTVTAENCCLSD